MVGLDAYLILAIPAGISASAVNSQTAAVAPATPSVAKGPVSTGKLFCHAYIYVVSQPGGFQSPIIERVGESREPALMMASLSAFVAKVRQQQPNQWRPFTFPLESCSRPSGVCFAEAESSMFKPKQMAAQFCFMSRVEAETDLQKFNTMVEYPVVD